MKGKARVYDDDYWSDEIKAAQERGYGGNLVRMAEVFYYAKRPINRFLDISCGPGLLLNAVSELLPEVSHRFWGVEPFPPPAQFCSKHPNFKVGFLHDLDLKFDAGVCIEVIEHLTPDILRTMTRELAAVSEPGAVYYFNSSQPSFVINSDPGYLDPHKRGHIASYSIEGLRLMFGEAGFTIHPLPGRDWGFLAEYGPGPAEDSNGISARIWGILPENREMLSSGRFGGLLLTAGLEAARCYLEAAVANWAVGELRKAQQ
ncbi:methyltransferase domain-containing protein [Xanthobacter sp. V2C-8]